MALRWVIRTAAGDEMHLLLRAGRYGALLVRNLRRGVQESVKLIGKGRQDQRLDAFVGSLRRRGRQGTGRGSQCDALFRDRTRRPRQVYDPVAAALTVRPAPPVPRPDRPAAGISPKIVARNHFVNKIFISLRGISPRFDGGASAEPDKFASAPGLHCLCACDGDNIKETSNIVKTTMKKIFFCCGARGCRNAASCGGNKGRGYSWAVCPSSTLCRIRSEPTSAMA